MAKNQENVENFETQLAELTTLVGAMENGGLDLETSLSQFEQGIQLVKGCQKKLNDATQKVEQLTQQIDKAKISMSPLLEISDKSKTSEL